MTCWKILKKFCLKGLTNVYLYRLLSFFDHRRQNTEFLTLASNFEILLMRLKAAMDLMPVHTAQSPEFIASVQEQWPRISKQPVTEPRSAVHRKSRSSWAALISAMSLRNISLENYTYEMMKTQYHDLFITTRTSTQDPSIQPPEKSE